MKAIILKEDLDKVMPVMARIVPNRGQLPVLSNVLIKVVKTGISFAVTNLELGLVMSLGGKVLEEGAITVPAKNLAEFVALVRPGEITLETTEEKLKVISGKTVGTFAGIAASEFPVLPEAGDKKNSKVIIVGKKIEEVAKKTGYAASVDEARLVLTGVKFYKSNNKLRVVATDGFRLARLDLLNLEKGEIKEKDSWPENLIIPAKAIGELSRLSTEGKKQEIAIEILKENNQVVFWGQDWSLISRILEGNFPEAEKLIPNEYKTKIIVDRKGLIDGVRSAAIFARENSNIVRLQIVDGRCQIKAVGAQIGEEESEIEAEVEGDEMEIAFNFKYVLDLLNSVDEERIILESNGAQTPGVWKGEGNEDWVGLIMPVRV